MILTSANPSPATIEESVRASGHSDGRNAAAWWIQDTIGARASGDVHAVARRILAGIDDGDPAVLQALPTPAPRDIAGDSHWWADLVAAYEDGFQQGCEEAIVDACHALLT